MGPREVVGETSHAPMPLVAEASRKEEIQILDRQGRSVCVPA